MRKQENRKDQIVEQLCSIGAVLMSIVGMVLLLYLLTILIRTIASFMA